MIFDFNVKTATRQFDASEWGASKDIYFKALNFFETMTVNELFTTYRLKETSDDEKIRVSFEMMKIALVDEKGVPVLTDADFEAIKNAPASPIIRAWCYATNPDYNRGETFKKK